MGLPDATVQVLRRPDLRRAADLGDALRAVRHLRADRGADGIARSSWSWSPCSAARSASRRRSCSSRSANASPRSPAASISAWKARWCSARWWRTRSPIIPARPGSGVLAAGVAGRVLGAHARLDLRLAARQRRRGRHRDDAVRHRRRLLLRQALHSAEAPHLHSIPFGFWSEPEPAQRADVNPLFFVGIAAAFVIAGPSRNTRLGLVVRTVGDSAAAARAMGMSVNRVRLLATTVGGFFAGVGGAFLSLSYPGSWNQGLSSGQGLMAVALVIFARWNPLRCVRRRCCSAPPARSGRRCNPSASPGLLFLQRGALILTLVIMIATRAPGIRRRHARRTHMA